MWYKFLTFLSIVFSFWILGGAQLISYEVKFEGDLNSHIINLLQSSSQLFSLKNTPPTSSIGLQRRAEADIPNFIKVLHSEAYYNAHVELFYDFGCEPTVIVKINLGPIYPFENFAIKPAPDTCQTFPYCTINLKEIGIIIGQPARPSDILQAEENVLLYMTKLGYPLSSIQKREVVADQSIQAIFVTLYIDSGPAASFGPVKITGINKVKFEFFDKKIKWVEGCPYDPVKIERTQNALEASGLFTTIAITHAEKLDEDQLLPMLITVREGKQRSIGAGLNYNTDWGPGVNAEWQHRNLRGMGERLTYKMNLWSRLQEISCSYVKPDYLRPSQDLIWVADLQHEMTRGFHESSCSISRIIERQISDRLRISFGGMYKNLRDTHADHNGQYNLLKSPLQLRWSNANNLLDPTEGKTINLRIIPSFQFLQPQFIYCINTLTTTVYYPLTANKSYVLAQKIMFGSILGSSRRTIPASERFYEGSEDSLRGYRYLTVSPLNDEDKPIGGRSLMIYTLELRMRTNETLGWVAFYDVGNVYEELLPCLNQKMLQSIGVGCRYNTPVGPLRIDLAFPLNPRPHLDHRFQLYLSIGQAF